jgi:hypothetical protein
MRRYLGSCTGPSDTHTVEVWEDNELVGLLPHLVKHSPDGFSWGYGGSGPADLARSLLADHLGPDKALCPQCQGLGTIERPDSLTSCNVCWGEGLTFGGNLYQPFKFEFVAQFPIDGAWEITSVEIDAWLSGRSLT